MPFIKDGIYVLTKDDAPFEAEVCYYLAYHVKSAIISIEKMLAERVNPLGFNSEVQYRHYYTDHLIFSLGQIANRFWKKSNQSQIYKHRVDANVDLFKFTASEYPTLCSELIKSIRNTVEHIEEYNIKTIQTSRGVGGFNTINENTDVKQLAAVKGRDDVHIYTLNLVEHVLYVKRDDKLLLDLDSLKTDLTKLYKRIEYVNSCRTPF